MSELYRPIYLNRSPIGYPRSGRLAAIEAVEPPVIKKMREILVGAKLRADRGELIVMKPWRTREADQAAGEL
jgi:hypothetical protein